MNEERLNERRKDKGGKMLDQVLAKDKSVMRAVASAAEAVKGRDERAARKAKLE
jgi:hypothetical protein